MAEGTVFLEACTTGAEMVASEACQSCLEKEWIGQKADPHELKKAWEIDQLF